MVLNCTGIGEDKDNVVSRFLLPPKATFIPFKGLLFKEIVLL